MMPRGVRRSRVTGLEISLGLVLAGALALSVWWGLGSGQSSPQALDVVAVGGSSTPTVSVLSVPYTDTDIANPERDAVQPPSGGPGPEDTRPNMVPHQTQAYAEYRDGLLSGFRLRGRGPDFYSAGFADGDLLVDVDASAQRFSSSTHVADLLIPGAVVAVERRGKIVEWRIGGKAE